MSCRRSGYSIAIMLPKFLQGDVALYAFTEPAGTWSVADEIGVLLKILEPADGGFVAWQ